MKKIVERWGYIYLLRNLMNGKGYVGQTIYWPTKRWAGHISAALRGNQRPLYRALRKYGINGFSAEVIWVGPETELNAAEKRYVRHFGTFIDDGWGYNLTTGGGQCRLSRRSIRKIRLAAKRQWADDVKRTRIHKAIILACSQESWVVNKTVSALAALRKAETHEHISRSAKRRANRPEERAKYSAMQKAAWSRPEVRERHKLTPEAEARRVAAVTTALQRPSVRKHLSKAQKAAWASDVKRKVQQSKSMKAVYRRDSTLRLRAGGSNKGRCVKQSTKRKLAVIARAQWEDPKIRQRMIENLRLGAAKRWAREEERRKAAVSMTALWTKKVFRKKTSTAIKRSHGTPEYLLRASKAATLCAARRKERKALKRAIA